MDFQFCLLTAFYITVTIFCLISFDSLVQDDAVIGKQQKKNVLYSQRHAMLFSQWVFTQYKESAFLADTLNLKILAPVILQYAVVLSLFLQNPFSLLFILLVWGSLDKMLKQSAASC